jgi:hypothetical protein
MINEKNLQQSKNWDKYINGELEIKFGNIIESGFPRYFYHGGCVPIKFKLVLWDGDIIENATIDDSRQYYAEGIEWRDSKGGVIYPHLVVAWEQMDVETKYTFNIKKE